MARYTPILKWKQGERAALQHLSTAGKTNVTPHLVLAEAQFGPPKRKISAKSATKNPPPAPEYAAKQIADAWGTSNFFLDVADLAGTATQHPLDAIRTATNANGMALIPSTTLVADSSYMEAVKRAVRGDDRGVALRVSLAEMTDAQSWATLWPFPRQVTDLIVDLGNSAASILALGQPVRGAFRSLHKAGEWRSVTMAGGNIPATLTGYVVGCTMLPRKEMELWKFLIAEDLPYELHFGDYTTIGPDSTTENIGGPVPINAKYTVATDFAVCHGVRIKGPGARPRDQQYRGHAKNFLNLPNRNPLAHCWGDNIITRIATDPTASPGSPASWVSYSVNRHIELTRSQLP